MTDNGARALAERLAALQREAQPEKPTDVLMRWAMERAAAILANGAVFKTAEEYEEILAYIDGLSTALSDLVLAVEAKIGSEVLGSVDRLNAATGLAKAVKAARAALQPEGSAGAHPGCPNCDYGTFGHFPAEGSA